jgi:glutathione S-transferase
MIELYHNDMSVCAQKVRFALAEKKLSWEGYHLNLRAGDQQKPGAWKRSRRFTKRCRIQ